MVKVKKSGGKRSVSDSAEQRPKGGSTESGDAASREMGAEDESPRAARTANLKSDPARKTKRH